MRTRAITVPLLLASVAAAGCGSSSNSVKTTNAAPTATTVTTAEPSRTYKVNLSGASEVPNGAAGATGVAAITVNAGKGQVCWAFHLTGVPHPAVAHIHNGAAGVAGPVFIPLGAAYTASGCQSGLPKAKIDAIVKAPAKYYVNVHNKQYPNGAVRAQL
jgi:hypothetical protein